MGSPLVILVLCLCSLTNAVPLGSKKNMAIVQEQEDPMLMMAEDEATRPEMMISRLNLPSNATSIRADITDGFSCDNKTYGYYADVENECQIFHVCLPVTYADGKENTFRWSFICPEETVFSQEYFTCMRSEDMSIDCEESFKYYELNRNFGVIEPEEMPADEAEEEMAMEDMSRQPPSQGQEETNKQPIEAAPVKKQTFKGQNSNRRKTQANRESQRKKVQPLRKLPTPVVAETTAKPIVEEAPIMEQEEERTTPKYQRFTKRPIAVVAEQPKPEEPRPEKEILRQDLFAQKRKRPQIYFPTRFDATVQTDTAFKPVPSLKTDIVLPKQPEPVVSDQAEAQASEIKEVSIKPLLEEAEKSKPMPVEQKEPAFVYVPLAEQPIELKSEITPLPENTPSRVEIMEIPIQKLDEPVKAEGSFMLVETPEVAAAEETKSTANIVDAMKTSTEEIVKKIVDENIAESKEPEAAEKAVVESVPETEASSPEEPAQPLQIVKSVYVTKSEPVKDLETATGPKTPEEPPKSEKDSLNKSEEALKSDVLLKEDIKEPSVTNTELPKQEENKQQAQMALKINASTIVVPEPEAEKLQSEIPEAEKPEDKMQVPKLTAKEPLVSTVESSSVAVEDGKPLEVEAQAVEPLTLHKTDIPVVKSDKPLVAETPADEQDMPMKIDVLTPEVPLMPENPASEPDMLLNLEEIAPESMKSQLAPTEVEAPSPDVKLELSSETDSKPVDSISEPIKEIEPLKSESSEYEVEKSSELSAEEKVPQPQSNVDKDTVQSAKDNEEAQSLILDFISSLVNSESSNFEDQASIVNEMSSDIMPEATVADPVAAEEEPVEIQTQDNQVNPVYIPMTPSDDQMYQIPVQVIETPEPESVPAVPTPVAAEPKLPYLSVDDVVELVKESLDIPIEKENIVQEPSNDDGSLQPESEEVKPIYHRYIELGSNLLKSEALTAADDEPVVVPTSNEELPKASEELTKESEELQKASEELPKPSEELLKASEELPKESELPKVSEELPKPSEELTKASEELMKTSEKLPEPEQLASQRDALEVKATQNNMQAPEQNSAILSTSEGLKEGRSLKRFRMDPRKRRFLFRSDAI